jgi:hypothetical protein
VQLTVLQRDRDMHHIDVGKGLIERPTRPVVAIPSHTLCARVHANEVVANEEVRVVVHRPSLRARDEGQHEATDGSCQGRDGGGILPSGQASLNRPVIHLP